MTTRLLNTEPNYTLPDLKISVMRNKTMHALKQFLYKKNPELTLDEEAQCYLELQWKQMVARMEAAGREWRLLGV